MPYEIIPEYNWDVFHPPYTSTTTGGKGSEMITAHPKFQGVQCGVRQAPKFKLICLEIQENPAKVDSLWLIVYSD